MPTGPHPSETIVEELEARGWDIPTLAAQMAIRDARIYAVALELYCAVGPTDPRLRMSEDLAQKLGLVFGVGPQFFVNLEAQYLGE
jgi:plasmid maintenance system antidote protein VapI